MKEKDFLIQLLTEKSMLICCGSGGVGKTTTSAVLALQAARMGRKALVLTIDPAKRLANSLGLESLGNQIKQIDPSYLKEEGLVLEGELHAMMLDCKRTFDDLVLHYSPNDEAAQRILNNRYYQHLSNAMTGSHEYMAMEKLYEIYQLNQFDIIILDTPPTQNALDFLDAPNRMANFLDESILKWFLKPYFLAGKVGFKTVEKGGKFFFKVLEKVTGLDVLRDVSEFMLSFSGMYSGFKERAEKVRSFLMEADKSSFLLITSPNFLTIQECIFFYKKLMEFEMPFGGIVVNKMCKDFDLSPHTSLDELTDKARLLFPSASETLLRNLAQNLINFQTFFERDTKALEHFKEQTGIADGVMRKIPHFDQDIFALRDLKMMVETIFPEDEQLAYSLAK